MMITTSILQSILALANLSPKITKWLSGASIDFVSRQILDIAKSVTNSKNETEAVEKLKNDKRMFFLFQRALINSEREIELAVIKDKDNARTRDIAIVNTGRRNIRADIMVIAAAVGLVACLATIVIYHKSLPGEAIGIISTVSGIFGACLKDAYNFEFGSSRGSKEKDQTVASILNKMS
ncbi:MAG: hypothetical protein LBI20_02875 [Holosporales bacterium]|jgi:hypothetical protein|nr:hypothetical protein [Holosporales bacterium]